MSRRFSASPLTSRFESLRTRGRTTLLAALAAPEAAPKPALPQLRGKALAKHHLALALEACNERGATKPQVFAALRLLVNQVEQGRLPVDSPIPGSALATATASIPVKSPDPAAGRRSKLLSRAFHSASQLADWGKSSAQATSI